MKLDLDDLERKANDASTPDEWHWRADGVLQGARDGQVVLYADEEDGPFVVVSDGDGAHIAAASPPVVLALIAVVRAAAAFVDEQGKHLDAHDELEHADAFAAAQWRDLVDAVKAAGR